MAHANPTPPDRAPARRGPRRSRAVRLVLLAVVAAMLTVGTPAIAFAQDATAARSSSAEAQAFFERLFAFLQQQFRPAPVTPPPSGGGGQPTAAPTSTPTTGLPPVEPSEDPPEEPSEEPTETPSEEPTAPPTAPPPPASGAAVRINGTAVDNLYIAAIENNGAAVDDEENLLVVEEGLLAEDCSGTGLEVREGGLNIAGTCLEVSVPITTTPVDCAMTNFVADGSTITFQPVCTGPSGDVLDFNAFSFDADNGGGAGRSLYQGAPFLEEDGDPAGIHGHVGVVETDGFGGLPQADTYQIFSAFQGFLGQGGVVTIEGASDNPCRVDFWPSFVNHQHFSNARANAILSNVSMYLPDCNGEGDGAAEEPVEGDLDGDGVVDDADGDGVADDPAAEEPVEGDLDGDGVVDDADGDGVVDDADGDGVVDDADGDGVADDAAVATPTISWSNASGQVVHTSYGAGVGGGHH